MDNLDEFDELVRKVIASQRQIDLEKDHIRACREAAQDDLKLDPKEFNRLVTDVLAGKPTVFDEDD